MAGLVGFTDLSNSVKLKEKEEGVQGSALIYMMGDKAKDILCSFGLKYGVQASEKSI